jgi:CelD/BcsL family acetyltransferase involved in cellulose biosynthesis
MAAPALAALQRDYAVYTLDKVGLPKGTKAVETAYYLPQVMDPAAYPNARKRHMRLVQPAKLLARHEVVLRQLSAADLPEIKLLHDAWVRHKLAQPDVMQIMFSKTRYYHCARIALTSPGYLAYGAYQGERLLAVRILYRQAGEAYDLAYFAATWDSFSNLTEALSMQTMRAMQAAGVDYLNCGMGLNKKLGAFKGHWPCEHPVCYAYPQL